MLAATRSELVRLLRPRLLLGWFGLMALFAVLINLVMFSTASGGGDLPPAGPGVAFPDAAMLESAEGLVAGVAAASSMFGVVTLSFWAIAAATDYSSGLIRLLVAAQPHRCKLLAGKVAALVVVSALATTVALVTNVMVATVVGPTSGLDIDAWQTDVSLPMVLEAWGNGSLALLVWGVIGLVLAVITRSAALAISIGVGWVLVVESVVSVAFDGGLDWLPGTTLTAVAQGGNMTLAYSSALALALGYVVVGLGVATLVVTRRDVTD